MESPYPEMASGNKAGDQRTLSDDILREKNMELWFENTFSE
jgi:hypothetical protein